MHIYMPMNVAWNVGLRVTFYFRNNRLKMKKQQQKKKLLNWFAYDEMIERSVLKQHKCSVINFQ